MFLYFIDITPNNLKVNYPGIYFRQNTRSQNKKPTNKKFDKKDTSRYTYSTIENTENKLNIKMNRLLNI